MAGRPGRANGHLERVTRPISSLRATQAVIPYYDFTSWLLRLPSREDIKKATGAMEVWSWNIFRDDHSDDHMEEIDRLLKLDVLWYYDLTGDRTRPRKRIRVKSPA